MGTATGSLIQVREDLTRKAGDTVVFPAMRRLVGAGVTGNAILEGNEELLNLRSMNLVVSAFRHAVAVSDWDEQKSVVDLREAAREGLMTWELEKMRSDIITSLGAITADGNVQVSYAAATAGQRNAWLVNNTDRALFGHLKANSSLRRHGNRATYHRLPRRPDERRDPHAGQAAGTHRQSAHQATHRQR